MTNTEKIGRKRSLLSLVFHLINFKDSTLGILSNQNSEIQKILTLKKETILLEKSCL